MKKIIVCTLSILICLSVAFSLSATKKQNVLSQSTIAQFRRDAKAFAIATTTLQDKLNRLTSGNKGAAVEAVTALKDTRLAYKKIEFFMEYYFKYPVNL
jgi:cytochrome c peroxidase